MKAYMKAPQFLYFTKADIAFFIAQPIILLSIFNQ